MQQKHLKKTERKLIESSILKELSKTDIEKL